MGGKKGRGDGEWWGISPPSNQPLGCFPVLTRQSSGISKSWPLLSHAESRLTPLLWKKRPQLERREAGLRQLPLPATMQTRQVAPSAPLLCCCSLSPSADSLKQNKRSLCERSGCSLMERMLLSPQQGARNKDCGKCVFQQQEIRKVSFVGARMFRFSSPPLVRTRRHLHVWIACQCLASVNFNTSAKLLP